MFVAGDPSFVDANNGHKMILGRDLVKFVNFGPKMSSGPRFVGIFKSHLLVHNVYTMFTLALWF